jgi:prepilin-type N-terminal cleavage/methylation domain-containing protein
MQQHNIQEKGFTMIELIVTLAILSFGIIGLYTAFTPLLYLTYNISSRFTAAYLAQEGLEIARNIRDDNFIASVKDPTVLWSHGLLGCSLGCQADYKTGTPAERFENKLKAYDYSTYLSINADGLYSYDSGGSPTKFKRDIIIGQDQPNSDILKVSVIVSWDYNNQPYNFTAQGYLYNWY